MKKLTLVMSFFTFSLFANAGVKDSIDQKIVDGQRYIVYKVEAKETLYSLSKKYNTSVDEIKNANNGLIQGLQNDATVLIPVPALIEPVKPIKPKSTLNQVQALHAVGEGETLYSISKKYNISVADIKLWNNLAANDIALGQELKVSIPKNGVAAKTTPEFVEVKPVVTNEKITLSDPKQTVEGNTGTFKPVVIENVKTVKAVEKTEYTIDSSLYGEEITVSKPIGKIGTVGIDQSKNLAQISNVKVGTILMIVNPLNNKASFVRVIEGDAGSDLKVTNAVLQGIGLANAEGRNVNVSYTK